MLSRGHLLVQMARNKDGQISTSEEGYKNTIAQRKITVGFYEKTQNWIESSNFDKNPLEFIDSEHGDEENDEKTYSELKVVKESSLEKTVEENDEKTYSELKFVKESSLEKTNNINRSHFDQHPLEFNSEYDDEKTYSEFKVVKASSLKKIKVLENIIISPPNFDKPNNNCGSYISNSVASSKENNSELSLIEEITINAENFPSIKKSSKLKQINLKTPDIYNYEIDNVEYNINDDVRDQDFNIAEYLTDTTCTSVKTDNAIYDIEKTIQPLSEKIKIEKNKTKKQIQCKYCAEDIPTKNFMRHLQRRHPTVKEVEELMQLPKNSKERRQAMSLLRNETNFNLYLKGTIKPSYQRNESVEDKQYYPCSYCKGLFFKNYLRRHVKKCVMYKTHTNEVQESFRISHLSRSHTLTACAADPTNVISQLNVKEQVFDLMRGDDIALEAKKDLLIAHFGNSYLKKHRRERMAYVCSNRMRELSRLLITYRKITNNNNVSLKNILLPRYFDTVISAVRNLVGYDHLKKTFNAPSLAMHLGTSLKFVCDELTHLILKETEGFKCVSPQEKEIWLHDIKNFKKLIESRWTIELASLANKDLQEKRWTKPLIVPLVSDIKKFRDEIINIANNCEQLFSNNKDDKKTYKDLVQCTLSLLIIFNRRRIGDVQFLKIKDYLLDKKTDFTDFETVLTEGERVLTNNYKRIVNGGKGSRAVVILVPKLLQNFITILLEHRSKYISSDNEYVFAMPGSRIKWGKGDVAIRTLADKIKLDNAQAISSNKLRKQIATVMQILNLNKAEIKQFSDFMGHTLKTHEEFYELPVDIYQTAKVSKILLMMEKGSMPAEYKGKSLSQINFDANLEYVEENDEIYENDKAGGEKKSDKIQNNGAKKDGDESIFNHDNEESTQKMDSDSEGSEELPKKKKKIVTKKGWTNIEVDLLTNHFKSFIETKTYPSGSAISQWIQANKINRTVPVVKSKIQHLVNKCKLEN
ncbi:unnamed protein product [Brassicogethes aeneus]|uniref:BED-type domain-containing protein n=1 Tax=Brassicogethes aeneus TaxID=1431903 RepID=A0A9P0B3T1_BRAAE|nr:unnamed protein product [Brassicogethes aeneus]